MNFSVKQVQDFHRRVERRKRMLCNCTAVLQAMGEGSWVKNPARSATVHDPTN